MILIRVRPRPLFQAAALITVLFSGSLEAAAPESAVDKTEANLAWNQSSLTEHRAAVRALVDELLGPAPAASTDETKKTEPEGPKPK